MGLIQNKVTVSQPNSHVVVKNAGGLRGLTGETGPQGPQGVPGEAATVTAGTTTTLPAGSDATVQNVGSTSAAIFNFGIPKGDKGDTGESGAAATISVGSTSTLPAGSSATVTNSGTSSAAVFDFGIPKGDKGDTGATGADGYSPSATVTKTGDTATITITDKDGTTTASISDGTTPTVNDGTLTIQKNGTTVQTFSADQASNVTANITVPTQFSDLSGTVSSSQIEDEAITTGSVSGTGTNITLAGTIAGGAIESVEMYGDTEQTTYSGKNLYQSIGKSTASGGLASTITSNGEFHITGTASDTSSTFSTTMNTSLPAGSYVLSITKTLPFNLLLRASNNQNIGVISAGSKSVAITTTTTLTSLWVWAYPLTNGTSYDETFGVQLESGSTQTSFEPYVGGTASPNPDYPQEVQTVTGRQVVTISDGGSQSQEYEINLGKNLLPFTNQNFTLKGVTFTVTNGTLYLNGTSEGETYANNQMFKDNFSFTLQPGTYILSRNNSHLVTAQIKKFSDGTTIASTNGTYTTAIFTLTEPTKVVFGFYVYQNVFDNVNLELMLEKSSTATTYAPYFTPIELCKIGTYQDYIYKRGGDWYVHKETKEFDLSTISYDGAGNGNFYNIGFGTAEGYNPSIPQLSNCFTYASTTWAGVGKFGIATGTGNLWLTVTDPTVQSEDAPTWLKSRGAIMYGVLRTPTDTQITNADLIAQLEDLLSATTYAGTTYITVSGDLASPLEVVAESDSKLAPNSVYGAAIKDGAVSVDKIADLQALADALSPYLN